MKVVATQIGLYKGRRRRPGDVFEIDEKAFSKTWMKEAPSDKEVGKAPVKEKASKPKAFSQVGKPRKSSAAEASGNQEVI